VASRWGVMLGLGPASAGAGDGPATAPPAQIHKVADGDTLRALAHRYLGNADRSGEIYEANRDVLPNPEVLPIGVELKIPPRRQEPAAALIPR
jgi:nucleoid-associated protein YgaU